MRLTFRRVRVFDGESVRPDDTVVVTDGVVVAIGRDLPVPPGTEVVDGERRCMLLPGLIDAHCHVLGHGPRQALRFGVTTELDMANEPRLIAAVKALQQTAEGADVADVRSAGSAATVPGGHGTQFLPGVPTLTEPDEAEDFVDHRIAEGSDYLKIHYEDGQIGARLSGRPPIPVIRKETVRAVAAAAAERGRLSVAHVGTLQAAREAVEVGVSGLAHVFVDRLPDPEFGAFAAAHSVFAVPTLLMIDQLVGGAAVRSLVGDPNVTPYLAKEDVLLAEQYRAGSAPTLPVQIGAPAAAVRALLDAGVPLLAGTDAVFALHGAGLHAELELLVSAGLSPTAALAAATVRPAAVFGLSDRGRIAVGCRADLLLVDGDPTRDIRQTRRIVCVWKQGMPVQRAQPKPPNQVLEPVRLPDEPARAGGR